MRLVARHYRLISVAAYLLTSLGGCGNSHTVKEEWNGVVNINTADVPTLTLLPGIRASTARRITDYRSENGRFKAPVELLLVRGIGEACFEQIQPWAATEGATTLTERVRLSRRPGTADACR